MRRCGFLIVLLLGCLPAVAQMHPPAPEDARTFREIMSEASRLQQEPYPEVLIAVGKRLLGKPYLAGLLDASGDEPLICTLRGFDCVQFVEAVLALAWGIRKGDTTWAGFARRVERLRYRDGVRQGYCSRLHYFTDWLLDNERRGHVQLLRDLPGSQPLQKRVDYMTAHRQQYPPLADAAVFTCISSTEARLQKVLPAIRFVPTSAVRAVYPLLQDGDIVAFTTAIDGLDVAHTGILVRMEHGGVGVIHASTQGAVVLSPDLERYLRSVKSHTGIIIARPLVELHEP